MRRHYSLPIIIFALFGCGTDSGLNLGRVAGTITFEGEPLSHGTVIFQPDKSKGTDGPAASATIKPDGTFELSTSDANDGAIVGDHRVGILGLFPVPVTHVEPGKIQKGADHLPDEDPESSSSDALKGMLQAKSKMKRNSGKSRGARLVPTTTRLSDGKTYRLVTPQKIAVPDQSGISVRVGSGSNTFNFAVREDGSVVVTN
jgi:hypothetical protein